jgi:hypothetical protein
MTDILAMHGMRLTLKAASGAQVTVSTEADYLAALSELSASGPVEILATPAR